MSAGAVFDGLYARPAAVDQLRAAAGSPVHAYLLVGPPGSGKRPAAVAFAAALLCPDRGCGQCQVCRRVLAQAHPDLVVIERQGAFISVAQAREIQRLAMRTPNEGSRKVLVLTDFHLVREAGPTLLKVVEEPPASTTFVILAEVLPPELVTIASRCVQVSFGALSEATIAGALEAEGVEAAVAARVAPLAAGRLDRARLLAGDGELESRRRSWASVPARLDGTGATVAVLVEELSSLLAGAALQPLEARHSAEMAELEERVGYLGERGSGRKELVDRHRRELRRLRADELRVGLGVLAGAYRTALVAGHAPPGTVAALTAIQRAAEAMERNPNEKLLLQALLLDLPALPTGPRDTRSAPE